MDKMSKLIKAVELKKPISFEYVKPNKIRGERIGNVHAIFIMMKKDKTSSTKVEIVQTGGVSDSKGESDFPSFGLFNIVDLDNIKILESEPCFEAHKDYKPNSDRYVNPIAKI